MTHLKELLKIFLSKVAKVVPRVLNMLCCYGALSVKGMGEWAWPT